MWGESTLNRELPPHTLLVTWAISPSTGNATAATINACCICCCAPQMVLYPMPSLWIVATPVVQSTHPQTSFKGLLKLHCLPLGLPWLLWLYHPWPMSGLPLQEIKCVVLPLAIVFQVKCWHLPPAGDDHFPLP